MKATGIVRRIDDLGRVVIPKEIRRTMRIREGDPLEIYTDKDGGVIFKKYSPITDLSSHASDLCASLYSASGLYCAVCDSDNVIAFSGKGTREVLEQSISTECEELIDRRKNYLSDTGEIPLTADKSSPSIIAASPIISSGDIMGVIAFVETSGKSATESDLKLLSAAATFMAKQMES